MNQQPQPDHAARHARPQRPRVEALALPQWVSIDGHIHEVIGARAKAGLPDEPPLGLLMSMAMRYDHGLGVAGYYDSLNRALPVGARPTHHDRVQATLGTMRQLYEEVSGSGYYHPSKEAYYVGLAGKAKTVPVAEEVPDEAASADGGIETSEADARHTTDAEVRRAIVRACAVNAPGLPDVSDDERGLLHYNPNTQDIIDWADKRARAYAAACVAADRARAGAPVARVTGVHDHFAAVDFMPGKQGALKAGDCVFAAPPGAVPVGVLTPQFSSDVQRLALIGSEGCPSGHREEYLRLVDKICAVLQPYEQLCRAVEAGAGGAAAPRVPHVETHGLDTAKQVFFYEQDFYVLSNFSSFNLRWKDITFPTSEHAYHWEKFAMQPGSPAWLNSVAEEIRCAPSAHEAFKIAERNKDKRRRDWDAVKVRVMLGILRAKAQQHEYVRRKLLATGDRELVENSWRDDFWGWGQNRDGQNMLGVLWKVVRTELLDQRPADDGTAP